MKPRTIADALLAKHGPRTAHQKVKARTHRHLYVSRDTYAIHRAVFWIVVGQMIENVGNGRNWT